VAASDDEPLASRLVGRRSAVELRRLWPVLSAAAGCPPSGGVPVHEAVWPGSRTLYLLSR